MLQTVKCIDTTCKVFVWGGLKKILVSGSAFSNFELKSLLYFVSVLFKQESTELHQTDTSVLNC